MDFGLLGPLVVRDGARPVPVSAPRQRVLLAALLLSAGRVVSLNDLAETLWEGQPPSGARGALHSAVQRLRSTLRPCGLVETRPPGYVINVGADELDVRAFGLLAERGQLAAGAGNWAEAAKLLREALGLWRGEPLADIPSRLLRDREVPPIEDQRLQALVVSIDADLHLGRHGEVVAELRQLVAAHPLQERFHAQLMLSLYRCGRQADALTAYHDVRRVLADDLGIDPGTALRALHQRILAGDSALLRPEDGGASDTVLANTVPAHTVAANTVAAGRDAVTVGRHEPAAGQQSVNVVPRQLPATARHFVGRSQALNTLAGLAATAAASHSTVISVIDGTAGIGKTTLALHFAHQVARQFRDGQLYVNLRGFDPAGPPMTPVEAIRLFLDAVGVPAGRIPVGLDAQAGLYRSLLSGKRMLIVLDNAKDVDQVRPLLPASPGCLVIVTSRSQLTSLVVAEGACPLSLDVLADAEGRELLTRHLGQERVASDPGAADELIQLCARLPLALSIAAARTASQSGLSIAAMTADLRDARGRLDALDAGHPAANVRAVFSWSYRQLDAATARLFRLLGLHAGPDISAAAAASTGGLALAEAHRRLGELTRAHLLAEPAPGRFSCHDLLRAYAAELAESTDSEAERRAATGRMLDHYLHTAYQAALQLHPTRQPITLDAPRQGAVPESVGAAGQALSWFGAEHQVLLAAAGRALEAGFDAAAWQITWALSRFLDTQGRWHDWAAMEQIALAAARRLGDRTAESSAHQRFGFASARLGRYDDAYTHLELALGIHAESGNHLGRARVHNSLAITLNYQGRYREALGHAQQALEAWTAAADRPGQAIGLNSVGWFHVVLGNHEEARRYCLQALDLFLDLGSREGVANALDSLGYAHQQTGDLAEASVCYRRALDLHRELGGRWGAAETLGHLGDTCHAAGNLAEAHAAWREALEILTDLQHPDAEQIRAKLQALSPA